jgi:hypothetical protein
MSAANRTGLIRNAAIAAIVGSTVGGTIGLWSLRHPAVTATTVTTAAPEAPNRPAVDVAAGSPQPHSQSLAPAAPLTEWRTPPVARLVQDPATATTSESAATRSPSAGTTADAAHVLERARALARRPDVAALIALREGVADQAAERGLAGSPSIKSELEELDQRLSEARTLQLQLDAEALRNADSKRPR